jgi:hypothetical protein
VFKSTGYRELPLIWDIIENAHDAASQLEIISTSEEYSLWL